MIDLLDILTVRCLDSENQPPDVASVVSIQLSGPRSSLMTSPIQISHLEAQAFAWRTQIMSLKGVLYLHYIA